MTYSSNLIIYVFIVVGVLTLLKYPYPRDITEPSLYEKVRVHAEWGKNRKSSIERQTDDSVQSVSETSFIDI